MALDEPKVVIPIPCLTPELRPLVRWLGEDEEGRAINISTSEEGVTVRLTDHDVVVERTFRPERFRSSEEAIHAIYDVVDLMGEEQGKRGA